MNRTKSKALCFEDFKVAFNEESVENLFQYYEEIGFLYPKKKALLAPHLKTITKNWKTLLQGKEEFLWVLTKKEAVNNTFSSVSVWKQSNYGMQAQHLVSNGNPFSSLKVMLASSYKAEHHFTKKEVNSSQNWFRPNNRYAYRVFASMYEKLGPKRANLRLFHYLTLPLSSIAISPLSTNYEIELVTGVDLEFINFVRQQYGEVFVQAEELNQSDILLTKMHQKYQQYGLHRYRSVIKFRSKKSGKIVSCAIINKAPIGINFSFLENRTHYIVAEEAKAKERLDILKAMNAVVKPYFQDFALQFIPIVTDEVTSASLQTLNANFSRAYMQSIWMRSGFAMWFDHIHSFLQKIEGRRRVKKAS